MKKLIVLLCLLFINKVASSNHFATFINFDAGLEQKVKTEVRQMQERVQFNEFEYIQIKKLTQEKLIAKQEAATKYANDAGILKEKLEAIENTYQTSILALLKGTKKDAFVTYTNSDVYQQFMASK